MLVVINKYLRWLSSVGKEKPKKSWRKRVKRLQLELRKFG